MILNGLTQEQATSIMNDIFGSLKRIVSNFEHCNETEIDCFLDLQFGHIRIEKNGTNLRILFSPILRRIVIQAISVTEKRCGCGTKIIRGIEHIAKELEFDVVIQSVMTVEMRNLAVKLGYVSHNSFDPDELYCDYIKHAFS